MKKYIKIITLFLVFTIQNINAQKDKIYLSIEEGLKNPKNVYRLYLVGNRTLSEDLGKFPNLQRLQIAGDDIFELPKSIGNLKNLEEIVIKAPIHTLPQRFVELKKLKSLEIRTTNGLEMFEQFPKNFGNLTALENLEIMGFIKALPEDIGNLKKLKRIYFYNRGGIKKLPHSFSQLISLQSLTIKNNPITQLPKDFGNLKNLSSLDMSGCDLQALPKSFGNLKNLRHLSLKENRLTKLPRSFGNLKKLYSLRLDHNKIKKLPSSFGNLVSLSDVNLENNQLKRLPRSFGKLSKLDILHLSKNKLKYLPNTLKNINGRTFHFSQNRLKKIPSLSVTSAIFKFNPIKRLPKTVGNPKIKITVNSDKLSKKEIAKFLKKYPNAKIKMY